MYKFVIKRFLHINNTSKFTTRERLDQIFQIGTDIIYFNDTYKQNFKCISHTLNSLIQFIWYQFLAFLNICRPIEIGKSNQSQWNWKEFPKMGQDIFSFITT